MNVYVLAEIAKLFSGFRIVNHCGRVGDNLIKLVLDSSIFYVDLSKSKSTIFCDDSVDFGLKTYNAPFDIALKKYCIKAEILDCNIDGNNRILRLKMRKNLQYKVLDSTLQLEFTGKYTNAIILDSDCIILESLRKITQNSRIVKNGIVLAPLPQQKQVKPFELNSDILTFLRTNKSEENTRNLTNIKNSALQNLTHKIKKLVSLKQNLPPKQELETQSQNYAKIGELLPLNKNAKITNNSIELQDYNGKKLVFFVGDDIDSNKNLINEFFTKSKKLKAKARNISLQSQNLDENIAFLESKISIINNAKNINDIKIITQKHKQNRAKKQITTSKYESFFIEDFKISIGKNENENLALLKDARSEDIWMHIRNIPSSHLIIHSTKKTHIKDEILQKAGQILVGFAKLKGGNFLVDYTKRKFVKIKEGANVTYSNQRTISVRV